jgi:uncharacterized protein (DUF983 family)
MMNSPQSLDPLEFELSFSQALARARRVRCPYCGIGRLFAGLIRMNSTCEECGTRLEREPGYFLGSTYINYGVTAGLTTVTYVLLHFGLGWPNHVLMPALMSFCLVFPLVFFRYARSLWLALDCFFDRVGARQVIQDSQQSESRREVPNNGA